MVYSQKILIPLLCLMAVSACSMGERLGNVGRAPEITPIENVAAPQRQRSISVPIPSRDSAEFEPNSLWRTGARAFFKDPRASRIGDILTVNININDTAQIGNTTQRSRDFNESSSINGFLGLQNTIPRAITSSAGRAVAGSVDNQIAQDFNPGELAQLDSGNNYTGTGTVNRNEAINLEVAAIVTDVLPNGNLVIEGRQEVRVNFEKRELLIAGIVRPEDISSTNIIQHSRIAEARIIYGGKGQLTDVQQPRVGAQLYDIIFPF